MPSPARPGRNAGYRSGLRASPASAEIGDLFSAHDKFVARLDWCETHTDPYAGIKAAGKRVRVPGFAIWRFGVGQVVETSTIQDQFAPLSNSDTLPATSTRRSRPGWAGRARLPAPAREEAPAPARDDAGTAPVVPAAAGRLTWRMSPMGCVRR